MGEPPSLHGAVARMERSAFRATTVSRGAELAQPPTDLFDKALVELRLIGAFRRLPDALVEAVGIVADQNAPAPGLDAVENDFCRGGGRGRRLVAKTARAIERDLLDVFVRP